MVSALRRAFYRFPLHYQTENAAKEVYYITSKFGKQLRRCRYTCAICLRKVSKNLIRRDHVVPVVSPTDGFPMRPNTNKEDWNTFIDALAFNPIQMICKECHSKKTKEENIKRKLNKKHVDSKN